MSRTYPGVRLFVVLTVALFAGLPATAVHADSELRVELEAYRVTTDGDGNEQFNVADAAYPGDVVEYRAHYTNDGAQTLTGVQAILPIPDDTVYLPASAIPARVEASLDGKTYEPVPLQRRVVNADGTESIELVPASEYRFLRFGLGDLGADATALAKARVAIPTSTAANNR